jgi:Flp pilus assembly protein TadG
MTSRQLTTMLHRGVAAADSSSQNERGQVLVIVAISLVALVAMVGLVVDGGYAWGKQRDTQNAADAGAKAGAVQLAENLAGKTPANTDADVADAVQDVLDANNVDLVVAYYTDITGVHLTAAGAPAASDDSDAAVVGAGTIPPGTWGVDVTANQEFGTFLAGVIGFDEFAASADATAVSGYLTGTCPAAAGCGILPVTVPATVLGCDGNNDPAFVTDEDGDKILWTSPSDPLTIPLCKNGPGNVGWLDWTPTAGGTSELEDAIENMQNPALSWPAWFYITATGNVNSAGIEDAINAYGGDVVMIPHFDITCDTQPDNDPDLPNFGCPTDHVGGNGSNQWYHLAGMSAFKLCTDTPDDPDPSGESAAFANACIAAGLEQGAYVSGSNQDPCDTGNGGTSCLAGAFVDIVYEGDVAASPGVNVGTSTVSIQLIE